MKKIWKWILVVFLIAFFVSSAFARKEKIYLNFDQVDIKSLVKFISKELGKNVIYDENLRGKITIISQKPMDSSTAWRMIAEALTMAGAVVYEEGSYIKIVSSKYLKEAAPPFGKKPEGVSCEPYILIYALTKLNPSKVIRIVRPLLSSKGKVYQLSGTPILIFKDYAENLKKMKKFLDELEKEPLLPEVKIFHLKYASVNEVYSSLSSIIQTLTVEKGLPFKLVKDERSNSLIVYGNKEVFKEVERLLKELDIPVEKSQREFYVIPLKFTSAEELAKVLKSLNLRSVMLTSKKNKTSSALREGIKIAADKSSNSLIVYATKEEFENLKKLIKQLDVRRKQVLLATTVVEISLSKLRDLGIHWQALGKYGGVTFGGASQTDIYTAVSQGNLVMGIFSERGKNISIGGTNLFFPDLLFLFSLLEENSSFRILSNPKILTLDNRKAEIKVGQSVPYTTGITYNSNSLPTVSFEYKDVGLNLTITPHIAGNTVRLEINQTIQEVTQVYRATQGVIDFVAPVTSKREISSEVMVDSGQTVILGGLVSKKYKKSASQVPGLSSIPLLGHLFKRTNSQEEKTTLFVFITPYIISSPEELKRITEEHKILSEDLLKLMNFKTKQLEFLK